jgi:phospholipid/cholesterol/gamma-HCH transport system substrate-binding protein
MNRRTLEVWVGVFVAAGVAALGMLAFKVGNLGTVEVRNSYMLQARFNNIGGLKVKAPVTMAGVRIGRVTGISFDNDKYQAVVKLDIDGRYKAIPADTIGSILTSGLLGEQYIGLDPGGDERYLKEGDTLFKTQDALVLEKMIGQFLFSQASDSSKK